MAQVSRIWIACVALGSVLAFGCEKKADVEPTESAQQAATPANVAPQPAMPTQDPAAAPAADPAAATNSMEQPSAIAAAPQAPAAATATPEAKAPTAR